MAELWDAAKRASAEQDWAECRAKASAAWALEKYGKLAGLMGHCELALRDYVNAARHLAYAVEHPGKDDPEALKALLTAQYARAKGEVATVTVSVSEPDAVVLLNGAPVAVGRHFLRPGKLVIAARRKGFEDAVQRVDAVAGEDYPVSLVMRPTVTSVRPPAPLPQPLPEPVPFGDEGAPVLLYVGVGMAALGVGGLAVGVGMSVVADDASVAAAELQSKFGFSGCLSPPATDVKECDELRNLVSEEDAARDEALGAVIAGGSLAAVGTGMIVMHFLVDDAWTDDVAWKVAPMVGPQSQGIWFQAKW